MCKSEKKTEQTTSQRGDVGVFWPGWGPWSLSQDRLRKSKQPSRGHTRKDDIQRVETYRNRHDGR